MKTPSWIVSNQPQIGIPMLDTPVVEPENTDIVVHRMFSLMREMKQEEEMNQKAILALTDLIMALDEKYETEILQIRSRFWYVRLKRWIYNIWMKWKRGI